MVLHDSPTLTVLGQGESNVVQRGLGVETLFSGVVHRGFEIADLHVSPKGLTQYDTP